MRNSWQSTPDETADETADGAAMETHAVEEHLQQGSDLSSPDAVDGNAAKASRRPVEAGDNAPDPTVLPELDAPAVVAVPPVHHQYFRFGLVGVSNAIVDLGVLNLLLFLHPTRDPEVLLAFNTIAVALAILNSYLWNTRWTFAHQATRTRGELLMFIGQGLLNIAANNVVLLAAQSVLQPSNGIWYLVGSNVAKLIAMVIASTLSFILLRTVVFGAYRRKQRVLAGRATLTRSASSDQHDGDAPQPPHAEAASISPHAGHRQVRARRSRLLRLSPTKQSNTQQQVQQTHAPQRLPQDSPLTTIQPVS